MHTHMILTYILPQLINFTAFICALYVYSYTCFYFDSGYVVLENCDTITQGIVAFPYALLLEAFVPYLVNSQPKVRT